MSIRIFINPSGQKDNLGDSVLRRAYLSALRRHGELHVYAGTHTEYISGLGLEPEDVVYSSRRSWLSAALSAAPRGTRTAFAMNAGEYVLDKRFLVNSLWQCALLLRSRSTGGRPAALGIAVRGGQGALQRAHFRAVLGLARTVSWRDPESRAAVGTGAVGPDWAFALGSAVSELTLPEDRRLVAVVLRGDRPAPGRVWIETVSGIASEQNAEVVVVNQMRDDDERCRDLAQRLGGTVLEWPAGVSHAAHEIRVREVYRQSVAVVSDRIHALILGLTEGAVPIGLTTSDPEKVRRTFSALTDLGVAFSEKEIADTGSGVTRARHLLDNRSVLLDDLSRGRRRLEELGRDLLL